jgi:hypothetical protein
MKTEQIDDGGPAFPSHPDSAYAGMTLRDWFAGMALQGMSANPCLDNMTMDIVAKNAWSQADDMLEARETDGRQ